MKKILLVLVLTSFTFNAFSCSCSGLQGRALEALKNADTVFLGVPTEDSVATGSEGRFGTSEMKTSFKVVKNFKNAKKEMTVYSSKGTGANCGVHFEALEGTILIYGYEYEGKITTNSCSLVAIDYGKYSAKILLELL